MQEFMKVTGMVIGAYPCNEFDKRLVILTKEAGKITVFVKGAKRPNSRFSAVADLFVFGNFDLYVGRTSYNLENAEVLNYFEFVRNDITAAYYGMYFMELVDYYTRENNDEALVLLLLYRAMQGLKSEKLDNPFVKAVFELKLFVIEGELIPVENLGSFSNDVATAVNYIVNSSIENLFSFTLAGNGNNELAELADMERRRLVDTKMKSLEILEMLV